MKNKKHKKAIIFSEQEMQIRKKYKINLLICLIYAIIIGLYFASLHYINTIIPIGKFNAYLKVIYMMLIIISIVLLEVAYKKEKKSIMVVGIELIVIALHTLLIEKILKESEELNILISSTIWPTYYSLKATIIYTIENSRRLKQISDISELVKEEKPTKKVAKKRKT